ncbi:MAG: hypothetical protein ACLR2E_00490 [Lachnospiraceae bacterium]
MPNGQARCEECPLKNLCRGHRDGIELEFPKKAAKSREEWKNGPCWSF